MPCPAQRDEHQRTHDRYILEQRPDMPRRDMDRHGNGDQGNQDQPRRKSGRQSQGQRYPENDEYRAAQPQQNRRIANPVDDIPPGGFRHPVEHDLMGTKMPQAADDENQAGGDPENRIGQPFQTTGGL